MSDTTLTAQGVPLHVAGSATSARALIVIHEAFGMTSHIVDVMNAFAEAGFYAVAPELFHRDGSPVVAYDDFPTAMGALAHLTREGITSDLQCTVDFLVEQGYSADQTGIVGYCMGGTVASFAGTLGIVGAAASFYGGGVLSGRFGLDPVADMVSALKCPWIGLYGELDKGIPVEHVAALRLALESSPVASSSELHHFPDADHGFNCPDRPEVFNATVAEQATSLTTDFFNRVVRPRD